MSHVSNLQPIAVTVFWILVSLILFWILSLSPKERARMEAMSRQTQK